MKNNEIVFSLHGKTCVYCGKTATTVDHMTPIARGGGDELENLAPCCSVCNPSKGAQTAEQYVRKILMRGLRARIGNIMEHARREIILEIEHTIKNNAGETLFAKEQLSRIMREKKEYREGGST